MTWSMRSGVVALWLTAVAFAGFTVHVIRTPRAHVRTESPSAQGLAQFNPNAPPARALRARDKVKPVPLDVRTAQARTLWERLGSHGEFGSYLSDIPQIPDALLASNERFPDLVLVDRRPFLRRDGTVDLAKVCGTFDISYCQYNPLIPTCVDFDSKVAIQESVYWIRMQVGRRYAEVPPTEARRAFFTDEVGATLFEVLSLSVQRRSFLPKGYDAYRIDAVGTVSVPRTAGPPTMDATAVASLVEERGWFGQSFSVRWKAPSSSARNATRWHRIGSADATTAQTQSIAP
ncbi:hypothetical protein HY480_01385 [Candidatus Uhrbacteria bacterium]|nr:hypothetical protein [Candidatus Uhrbacteria bacterium]